MRIIVLGIPHTQTSRRFSHCAFTQKVYNLCKMMRDRGHEVIHVGVEVEDGPPCTKNIACVSKADWEGLYGKKRPEDYFDISVDDDAHKAYAAKFAEGMRKAVVEAAGPQRSSIICATWGGAQQTAVADLPQFVVESGIGYRHTWANYRVYESYAWLHMHLGTENRWNGDAWYWTVIPNAFDTNIFDYREKKDDYALYLGRLNDDKGIGIAIDITREMGWPLRLAGQGDPQRFLAPHVTAVGPVGVEERRQLLAGARALFVPTRYVGPFEGVHIEAGLSGTPVITTDWGAFPETVLHGVTGFRCRNREQFLWAAQHIHEIQPIDCRRWTQDNFSLERVAAQYEDYFQAVLAVSHDGWYAENSNRQHMDARRRSYPMSASRSIRLDPVPNPTPKSATKIWQEAQVWERQWWKNKSKWAGEIKKQLSYARLMGMPDDLDFGDKRILDVGCGPVSLLLRSKHGPSVGVDPMPMDEETLAEYARVNSRFIESKAEDMSCDERFDEAWIYNCLQHVEDVHAILTRVAKCADEVRVFEWIDLPPCSGHPQTITEEQFTTAFPASEWEYKIYNVGALNGFGGTVTNRYLALYLVRR